MAISDQSAQSFDSPTPAYGDPGLNSLAPNAAQSVAGGQPQATPGQFQPYDPTKPYQAETMPGITPQVPQNLPEQQPIRNLGAANQGGGAAYIGSQLLQGFMQGTARAQMVKAVQLQKQQQGLQANYHDAAENLYNLAQSGVDQNSQQFQDARSRVDAAWQSQMDFYGQHIQPQTTNKKTGQQQPDQGNFITRLHTALGSNDPAQILPAVFEGLQKAGPPVYHQIQQAGYLTPGYQANVQQRGQAQAQTVQAGLTTATDQAQQATNQLRLDQLRGNPNRTPEEEAEYQALRTGITPPKWKSTGPTYADPNDPTGHRVLQNMVDQFSNIRPQEMPEGTPATFKPQKVSDFMSFVKAGWGNSPDKNDYIQARNLWQPTRTTTGTHTVMVPQRDGSILPVVVETSSVSGPSGGRGAGGAGSGAGNANTEEEGAAPGSPSNRVASSGAPSIPHANQVITPKPGGGVVSVGSSPVGGRNPADVTKLSETADTADLNYKNAQGWLRDAQTNPASAQNIVMAFVRSQVAGAGRMNNVEIQNALKNGTFGQKYTNMWQRATEGTYDQSFLQNMVDSMGVSAKNARDMYNQRIQPQQGGSAAVSTATAPKTTVSITQAMQLPKYKGQSRAQVSAAITAAGHLPVD